MTTAIAIYLTLFVIASTVGGLMKAREYGDVR